MTTSSSPKADKKSKKYKVFQSINETIQSLNKNPTGIVAAGAVSIGLSLLLDWTMGYILTNVFDMSKTNFLDSGQTIITGLIITWIVYLVGSALVGAFITSSLSLAYADGAEGKQSNVSNLLTKSFGLIVRVTLVNLLIGIIIMVPILVGAGIALLLSLGNDVGSSTGLLLLPLVYLIGFCWAIVAIFRYALAPVVAIFEPKLAVKATLTRSKQLMTEGGEWFLLKAVLLFIAVMIVASILTGKSMATINEPENWLASLIAAAVAIIGAGMMVMLYRNRKVVRG